MAISRAGSTPATRGVRICAPKPSRAVRSQAVTVPSSPEEYARVPCRFTARARTVPPRTGRTSRRTQRPPSRSLTTSRWSGAAVTSTDPAAFVAAADIQLVWSAICWAGSVAPGGYQCAVPSGMVTSQPRPTGSRPLSEVAGSASVVVVRSDRSWVTVLERSAVNMSTVSASAENPRSQLLVSSPAPTGWRNTGGPARPVRVSTYTALRMGVGPLYPATTTTPSRRPSAVNRAVIGQPPRSGIRRTHRTRPSGPSSVSADPAVPGTGGVTTATSPAVGPVGAGDAATSLGSVAGLRYSVSTRGRCVATSQATTCVSVCA